MKISFSPSVYEHAAYIISKTPWEVSRNGELMYKAHAAAYELYRHTPIIVGIDIYNLEAEAYGGKVKPPDGIGIPATSAPLFNKLEDALNIKSFNPKIDGRIQMIIQCGRRLKKRFPDAKVCIPVSGLFSIATSLRGGNELLLDIITEPDSVRELLYLLIEGQIRFCKEILDAGLDIALFESAATPPLLSPQQFESIELPPMKRLINRLKDECGIILPFIIGGDTTPILESLIATGTNYLICPAETDRNAFMTKMSKYPDVAVRINLSPLLMSFGPVEDILKEVDAIIEISKKAANKVLLGTGVVPYETPPKHILTIKDYVSEI